MNEVEKEVEAKQAQMEAYAKGFDAGYNEFRTRLLTAIPITYRHIAECDGKLCPSSIALRKLLKAFGIAEVSSQELYEFYSKPQPASVVNEINVQPTAFDGPRRLRSKRRS